ncbi:MAG: hypothetical protein MUC77_09025 [Chromatiaceae bacterium]|nr:hypothetical protein [Chromatiaceae bacterium]
MQEEEIMANIGFAGWSAGASRASVSNFYLAVRGHYAPYIVGGLGGGHATIASAFRSREMGGTFIPDRDGSGRQLPGSFDRRVVYFKVHGWAVDSPARITLKVFRDSSGSAIAYEWSGMARMVSSCFGGFECEGVARCMTHEDSMTNTELLDGSSRQGILSELEREARRRRPLTEEERELLDEYEHY